MEAPGDIEIGVRIANNTNTDTIDTGGSVRAASFSTIYSASGGNYSLVRDPKDGANPIEQVTALPGAGAANTSPDQPIKEEKLGLFWGVYMPCIQNILGVILFIRLPWIVAQAGVILTACIIIICVFSTFITSLSMSAIATNGKIMAGGPYYVVSRNLGVEIGGSVGVIFYLGTTMAASMYILGAIEALQSGFGLVGLFTFDKQIESLILAFLLTSIVSVGVKYVNLSATFFLSVVLLSIFSSLLGCFLFMGGVWGGDGIPNDASVSNDNLYPNWAPDKDTGITPTFFSLIGLFYPSVTGIMAGSNRSGVLANPGRDIPTGTVGAIMTTTTIYLVVVFLLGSLLSNEYLKDDKLAFASISWPPVLVNIGIVMSSVGACLQSLTGAPRLLAAIANDGVIPFLDVFKCPGDQNPTKAIWMTWFVCSLPCLAGNLDFITPIVTMFFVMMYATVNLATFLLSVTKAPGFRPTFKYFSVYTAAIGVVWCIGLMFVISWYTALICLFLAACLYIYIASKHAERDWGDIGSGLMFKMVRTLLSNMKTNSISHPKNWRPQLMVLFSVNEDGHTQYTDMIRIAGYMKKGRGLISYVGTMQGDLMENTMYVENAEKNLAQFLEDEGIRGFSRILVCEDRQQAFFTAIQTSGIGALVPNAIMTYWSDSWMSNMERIRIHVDSIKFTLSLKKALILYKKPQMKMVTKGDTRNKGGALVFENGTIDIWWVVHDGGLLLLIPYLLTLHEVWATCALRLFAVTVQNEDSQEVFDLASAFLSSMRISATITVVPLGGVVMKNLDECYAAMCATRVEYKAYLDSITGSVQEEKIRIRLRTEGSVTNIRVTSSSDASVTPLEKVQESLRLRSNRVEQAEIQQELFSPGSPNSPNSASSNGSRRRAGSSGKDTGNEFDKAEQEAVEEEIDRTRLSVAIELNKNIVAHCSDYENSENQDRVTTPVGIESEASAGSGPSGPTRLVVTNLPLTVYSHPSDFMHYAMAITSDMACTCLLVRGTGEEVVTPDG